MGEQLFSYDILDAELAKLKTVLLDEIKSLKNENKSLQKEVDDQKREVVELKSKQFSTRKIESMIEDKLHEMRYAFIREKELGSLLNKNKDFRFVLDHMKELDRLSITNKEFKKFDQNVNNLRRESAYLTKLGKEMERLSDVEKLILKVNRGVEQLTKRFESYEVRKWK